MVNSKMTVFHKSFTEYYFCGKNKKWNEEIYKNTFSDVLDIIYHLRNHAVHLLVAIFVYVIQGSDSSRKIIEIQICTKIKEKLLNLITSH